MREIKFRVWNGEAMVSPDYIDRNGIAHWKENSIPQSSGELMQYTGLKDKKGKEIYEGDKLQFTAEDEDNTWIVVVKWSEEMLSWCLYDDKDDSEPLEPLSDQIGADFEVIGNIYEGML